MKRLAIIAGGGHLPVELAGAATKMGYEVLLLPIEGQADADLSGYKAVPIRLGGISTTRSVLLDHDITQIVMLGKVTWPSLSSLRPDFDGIKLLGKMLGKGDDTALRTVAAYFADKGIETLSADQFLPHRKLEPGIVTGTNLNVDAHQLIAQAVAVLQALGNLDVGQSIIVQNGRVLAIEAAEGTNAMIARCKDLVDPEAGPACFVKMAKTGQDKLLDMPVIGCETIEVAARAGITLIAVEAAVVLLGDDLEQVIATCQQHQITLLGMASPNADVTA